MHNTAVVEIIWQRVRNTELIQYLTVLKVQFQHQPRNYREVLQDIAIQVPSIFVNTFRKESEVSVQGTDLGGAPAQGIYESNGLLFHGTYPETKWFSDSVKPHWEDIRRACDAANSNSGSYNTQYRGLPDRVEWDKNKREKSALEATISELNIKKSKIEASVLVIVTNGSSGGQPLAHWEETSRLGMPLGGLQRRHRLRKSEAFGASRKP